MGKPRHGLKVGHANEAKFYDGAAHPLQLRAPR
jgi:hypothetical protein